MPQSDRREVHRKKSSTSQISERGGGDVSPFKRRAEKIMYSAGYSEGGGVQRRRITALQAKRSKSLASSVHSMPHCSQQVKNQRDEESDSQRKKSLICTVIITVVVIMLVTLMTFVGLEAVKKGDAPTLLTNGSSLQRNGSFAFGLFKYNLSIWNRTTGNCGKPKEEPELSSRKHTDSAEVVPHSWPWQVALVRYVQCIPSDKLKQYCMTLSEILLHFFILQYSWPLIAIFLELWLLLKTTSIL